MLIKYFNICVFSLFIRILSAQNATDNLTELRNENIKNRSNDYDLTALHQNVEERSISDLLITARNMCSRIKGYAEFIESNLPNIHSDLLKSSVLPTRLNLVVGVRNFIIGVKQIANSMENILTTADIAENKELSLHTTFGLLSKIAKAFESVRSFLGQVFINYNYYIPEILLTKCLSEYIRQEHPHRSYYEYPFELFKEIFVNPNLNSFPIPRPPVTYNITNIGFKSIPTPRMQQKFEIIGAMQNDYNDMDNEIFHNETPSEASSQNESILSLEELKKRVQIENPPMKTKLRPLSWKKCIKFYTLEILVRIIEGYLTRN